MNKDYILLYVDIRVHDLGAGWSHLGLRTYYMYAKLARCQHLTTIQIAG